MQNAQTIQKDLERIGLTEKEARVYLAALELGSAPVKSVAQKAELSRPATHIILESLTKRGLASAVREGEQTVYSSEHPKQLGLILRKEQARLDEQEAILNDIVPELSGLFHKADTHPIVKIYLGSDGAQAMDEDGLRNRRRGHTAYSFTALDVLEQYKSIPISTYAEKRMIYKEPLKVIYTHEDGPKDYVDDPKLLREARYISHDKYPFEGSIVIRPWFGLRIFSHRKNEFVGITIESKELALTMKSIFMLCWNLLDPKVR